MIATIAVIAGDRSDHSDQMETIFQRSQRQAIVVAEIIEIAGKWFPI